MTTDQKVWGSTPYESTTSNQPLMSIGFISGFYVYIQFAYKRALNARVAFDM